VKGGLAGAHKVVELSEEVVAHAADASHHCSLLDRAPGRDWTGSEKTSSSPFFECGNSDSWPELYDLEDDNSKSQPNAEVHETLHKIKRYFYKRMKEVVSRTVGLQAKKIVKSNRIFLFDFAAARIL